MTFQTASLEKVKRGIEFPLSRTVSGYEVVMDVDRNFDRGMEKGQRDDLRSRVDWFLSSIMHIEARGSWLIFINFFHHLIRMP